MSETFPPDPGPQADERILRGRQRMDDTIEAEMALMTEAIRRSARTAADSLADELAEAAARGRLEVEDLVAGIVADLSRLAADQLVRAPIEGAFASIFGGGRNRLGRSDAQLAAGAGGLLSRGGRNA